MQIARYSGLHVLITLMYIIISYQYLLLTYQDQLYQPTTRHQSDNALSLCARGINLNGNCFGRLIECLVSLSCVRTESPT